MSSLFYQSHTNDDYEYEDEYNDDNMYDYQNNVADDSDEGNYSCQSGLSLTNTLKFHRHRRS